MNTCSTHVKEKSTQSAKLGVFASSPPGSYFRNCLPKRCSKPSATEETLRLNYVCLSPVRSRPRPPTFSDGEAIARKGYSIGWSLSSLKARLACGDRRRAFCRKPD